MKHSLRLNSNLTPAAFYWYLGSAAFGAAGYTRRNPPTKSHHNGAARTRQTDSGPIFYLGTAAGLLVLITLWEGKSLRRQSLRRGFRWLVIDGRVFNFNHNFTDSFSLVSTSLKMLGLRHIRNLQIELFQFVALRWDDSAFRGEECLIGKHWHSQWLLTSPDKTTMRLGLCLVVCSVLKTGEWIERRKKKKKKR